MNNLRFEIEKIFKGAGKSFSRFPGAIISAIVVSVAAFVKIGMAWEVQENYSLLFESIQLSFFLGAVFSMAAVAFAEVKSDKGKSNFLLANLAGIVLAFISFILLYFYGGKIGEDKIAYLSTIAMARVSVAIFISIVAFIYVVSKSKAVDSFSDSFFISHRAFIISAIYGIVMMIGVSGVVGAFQALIYRVMDNRVYEYLVVIVGFLTYTIFLGYFPSFKTIANEDEIEKIEEQPRFIFVLFEYILIPIMMALTVVLLLWSVRVVLSGMDVSFNQLSGIASSYVIVGIWLHIMVAKHETKISSFYKRAYPFAGILILIFEAWALYVQLNKFGLKTAEYSFLMIWIFAIISVFLLIFQNNKAYRKIALVAAVISIIWVLPIIGYEDITFNSQVKRLEEILIDQELLISDEIVASNQEVDYVKRGEITDAVDFISYSEKENIPNWFKKELNDDNVFRKTFGFEKTYGLYPDDEEYNSASFRLETDVIDISDYSLSLASLPNERESEASTFEGENGTYEIIIENQFSGVPKITVKLEGDTIVEKDLKENLSDLLAKYPSVGAREIELPLEDMSVAIDGEEISILLVFNNINAYSDEENKMEYYLEYRGIFIKYK